MIATDTTSRPTRPCALLVDDNPMILQAMGLLLGSLGWDTLGTGHAEQALEQLKWKEYDLAILDLKMPDTDGIELCRLIHLNKKDKTPPILIHSGYMDGKNRAAAINAGVDGILDKPIGRDELISVLEHLGLPCGPSQ